MKNFNSQKTSPQANFESSNYKKSFFLSHKLQSSIDVINNSENQILRENRQALNLSSLNLLDQSSITYKSIKSQKENKENIASKLENKSIKKFTQVDTTDMDNQDQIKLIIMEPIKQLIICQICHLSGKLIQICECKYIHQGCMKQKKEELQIDLKSGDLKSKLQCQYCKNYYQIHLYTNFDRSQCKVWKNVVCSILSVLIMITIIGLLMAFIANNKEYVYFHPEVFILILIFCLISFVSVVSIVIHILQMFQKWQISFREYVNVKEYKEANLQQIIIFDSLQSN